MCLRVLLVAEAFPQIDRERERERERTLDKARKVQWRWRWMGRINDDMS
jgi:hypothetical protein